MCSEGSGTYLMLHSCTYLVLFVGSVVSVVSIVHCKFSILCTLAMSHYFN